MLLLLHTKVNLIQILQAKKSSHQSLVINILLRMHVIFSLYSSVDVQLTSFHVLVAVSAVLRMELRLYIAFEAFPHKHMIKI